MELFCSNIMYYKWGRHYAMQNMDEAWAEAAELYGVILRKANEMWPIKTFSIKGFKPSWYTDNLIELIANRDDLFHESKLKHDPGLLVEARQSRLYGIG